MSYVRVRLHRILTQAKLTDNRMPNHAGRLWQNNVEMRGMHGQQHGSSHDENEYLAFRIHSHNNKAFKWLFLSKHAFASKS